jgi:hypothetical protein
MKFHNKLARMGGLIAVLSCLFGLSPAASVAQENGTVTGSVVDEASNRPLRGAVVELLGTRLSARTDFFGRFILSATPDTYPGVAIFRPGVDFPFLIEAELGISPGQEQDLGELPVPEPPAREPADSGPEQAPNPADGGNPQESPQQAEPIPWVGIQMKDWSMAEGRPGGPEEKTVILVDRVLASSPAKKAGLQELDVIVSVNGKPVGKMAEFQGLVKSTSPGETIDLMVLRGGGVENISIQVETISPSAFEALQDSLQPAAPGPDQQPQTDLPQGGPSGQGQGTQSQGSPPGPSGPKTFYGSGGDPNNPPPPNQGGGPNGPPPGGSYPNSPPPGGNYPGGQPPQGPGNGQPPQGSGNNQQRQGPQIHPLIQEARDLTAEGRYQQADEAYKAYSAQFPNDGPAIAEHAMMVFYNIQNARGMALMAQAVKKPGLPIFEKTRLRLIIAERRLQSGNLATAKQMLIEAKREDPANPIVNDLLYQIHLIELEMAARARGGGPVPIGVDPLQAELMHQLNDAIADMLDD